MPDPISHAEMIAWCRDDLSWKEHHGWPEDEIEKHRAVLAHLERTQWRPRSGIADSTLGLDTEVLGFQPDIGHEAEDEIPSRYGVTTAGHLASGGWEQCTYYLLLHPPSPETP